MKNKLVVVFRTFLVLSFLAATGTAARAQEHPDSALEQLEGVVVTASRLPAFLGESVRIVTVLDSLAISTIPASNINDLLKFAVGVDVRQRGPEGVQTDISLRGGTGEQLAVLLDGICISDPQTGHNSADFPVPVSEIERIEILAGPAARTYGTSSLLGAINIVTRKAARSGVDVRLEGGSYGLVSGSVGVQAAGRKVRNALSANYTRSDGYTRNREGGLNMDFRSFKAFYRGDADLRNARLNWHAGASVKDFGSGTFYSPKFDDQFEHTFKTFVALQGEFPGLLHLRPRVYWNHGEDRFELFRAKPERYPFNYHRTDVLGLNLDAWVESVLGRTAFGAEVRNEGIVSTNLGEPLRAERPVPGHDATYKRGLNRTDISFFVEHNFAISWFSFSGGASLTRNTGNDEGFRLYPGADASFTLSPHLKLYASYNSSLRMPSFTELYYSVGGYQADKNLRAEKMQSVELGFKYHASGVRIVGSVYGLDGRDLIDWIRDLSVADAPWQSVNHARIRSLGEELTVRIEPAVLLKRQDFPVRSFSASYAHISQDKKVEPGVQSYYALEYLRNKLVLQADLRLFKKLSVELSWRWQDRVGSYELYQAGATTGEIHPYRPYSLVDGKLSWDEKKWSVWLEADNILNASYVDHGNVPQPGIWVKLGASYRLFR
ncbi:MAG: TonB-dependent receptor [Bacteroidales bacterium]|nr:TonB-dependent receptor [Bacteroidales bacterium]